MRASLSQLLPHLAGARLQGADCAFEGVATDSRSIPAGSLFVALRGERFDAHDFLPDAAKAGAAAVVAETVPEGLNVPALIVPDTLAALAQIARYWRQQHSLPVIAVTGSNGKTTVKEMVASILAAAYGPEQIVATRGNLNNEIGVPLSVFRLEQSHRAAVFELGMNHPGEIARLTAIALPTVALVNNAQREHQEFMVSVEAVALENGAVLEQLGPHGVAVYPADDAYTTIWRGLADGGGSRSFTFGLAGDADVTCTHAASAFGSDMTVAIRESGATIQFAVSIQAAGLHNVRNALAAIAATYAMGVATSAIVSGLAAFAPVQGRLQRKQAIGGAAVIDDTYNANPDSARAAIDVLAGAPSPRVLVLGDMGEVGSEGPAFHEEIGQYAR
ncbi:MAG TPA: UDP-N-acetylmuramoyl-tripeptide--D-alanyl-D-alanine ligase, partial [Burkholderiaceae bacterium]